MQPEQGGDAASEVVRRSISTTSSLPVRRSGNPAETDQNIGVAALGVRYCQEITRKRQDSDFHQRLAKSKFNMPAKVFGCGATFGRRVPG